MLIDCITPPPVDAMRAAGVTGLSRYLSWADSRDTLHKVIHLAEYEALTAAGFDILLNWEYSATDWLGGATAGAAHAAEVVRQAKALGYPQGCAIPGSADFDMTHDQWNGPCWAYAKAYSDGIRAGGYRAGVYGPWDVLDWCRYEGWFDVYWQAGMSTAWSGGRNAQPWPGAHLRQRYQTYIGGVDCDVNDILQPNYGQAVADVAQLDRIETMVRYIVENDNTLQPDGTHKPITTSAGELCAAGNGVKQELDGISAAVAAKPAPASVTLTDADRQAIADLVLAGMPKPLSAAEIAKAVNDDAAARLQS